jgi:hypothetical protein
MKRLGRNRGVAVNLCQPAPAWVAGNFRSPSTKCIVWLSSVAWIPGTTSGGPETATKEVTFVPVRIQ